MSRKILLILAGVIFLLHGLIPHKHKVGQHSDTALAQEMSASISSLIEFIFHEDLDQGSLEHVVVSQPNYLASNPQISIPEAAVVYIQTAIAIEKIEATQAEITYSDPLRGPPMLS